MAGTLGITPEEFVGVGFRGMDRQEMEREFAPGALHIRLDHLALVCRPSVEHGVLGLFSPVHQLFRQSHEPLPVQAAWARQLFTAV